MADGLTGRTVPTWVGASPDSKIPKRVRLRVFERHNGICHLTGRKIRAGEPWDCDHIVALCNGGAHAEDNLAPALKDAHKTKTREDVAIKSKTYRVRAKHLGIKPKSGRKMQGRGFDKSRTRHMDGTVSARRNRQEPDE